MENLQKKDGRYLEIKGNISINLHVSQMKIFVFPSAANLNQVMTREMRKMISFVHKNSIFTSRYTLVVGVF